MTQVTVTITRNTRESSRKVRVSVEASLERLCRRTWPRRTAACAAHEWALTIDEARELVRGRASKRVLEKIWTHPRGGWPILVAVMEPVIGEPITAYAEQTRQAAARMLDEASLLDFGPRGYA